MGRQVFKKSTTVRNLLKATRKSEKKKVHYRQFFITPRFDLSDMKNVTCSASPTFDHASSIVQDSDPYGLTLTEVEKLKEEKKNKDNK